jgi:hypothetical protein
MIKATSAFRPSIFSLVRFFIFKDGKFVCMTDEQKNKNGLI